MSLLNIQNLEVSFAGASSDTVAVKNLSMSINQGESLGLVGASGCGKSTLIHAILRSLQPPGIITSGRIDFNGTDLCAISFEEGVKRRWKDISLVVQSALSALNPIQNIGQHFEDTLQTHTTLDKSDRLALIHTNLDRVRLPHHVLDSYPHQLSGGMQQRVVIALALLLSPKLIIFDEPTTALDVQVEKELLEELKSLQHTLGFAALFVSHDLDVISQVCSRVCVMHKGELVDDVSIDSLHSSTVPYTQLLLSSQTLPNLRTNEPGSVDACLTLNNITQVFVTPATTVVAVRDVNLTVHEGECIGLVGASGSGKSTLGRIIAEIQKPTSGELIWRSEPDKSPRRSWWRWFSNAQPSRVQLIFQNPFSALNPTLTIAQSLSHPLQSQKLSPHALTQRLQSICEQVGLSPIKRILSAFPHELSGGQRQRVCIARALLGHPKILVADEPTSMLDVSLRSEILALLKSLQQQHGFALVLITHDLLAARCICDRLLICHDGEVVERGETEQIFKSPQHPFTQSLIHK